MFLLITILALGSLMVVVVHCWKEISEETEDFSRAWFLRWTRRGLLTPVLVWLALNVGKMPFMPPLTKHIAHVRAAGDLMEALLAQTSLAAMVIGSCWAALTFGWFLVSLLQRARNSDDLILAAIVWIPVMLILFWIFRAVFGWAGMGFAAVLSLWPLAQYSLNVAQLRQPAPSYSRAIGKIKFGKYSEAEMAIIGELERCESDFDGWMMLAELYANQFHDLAEAEKTICELCDTPGTTVSQISVALHRLADWQLQLRGDPVAARRVLEEIGRRMPGTHLALMARNRSHQLPGSIAELNEQQQPRTVTMPALSENLAYAVDEKVSPVSPEEAMLLVNRFVEELKQDPNDIGAREKLARVFAQQMGEFDLAAEQLELLIGMPGQAAGKIADWLAQVAAWQIRQNGEGEAAMKTLERLIHEFPQSAQAFAAQRQLSLLKMNVRMKSARLAKG